MKNNKYLKCSYYVEMAKYDLNNNRSKSYSLTWYNASGSVIDTSNIEYYSEWTYPMPDSMGEGIMYMVKMLIAMQESD